MEVARHICVHCRRQGAIATNSQVRLAKVSIARQEAWVDRCPRPRATHTDAITITHRGFCSSGGVNKAVEIGWNAEAVRVKNALVIGQVVLLIGQWDTPLHRVVRAQCTTWATIPRTRFAHAFQNIFPVVIWVGFGGIHDVFVQIVNPACRAICPSHLCAAHEGILFA